MNLIQCYKISIQLVTMLNKFLVQAHLNVDESVLQFLLWGVFLRLDMQITSINQLTQLNFVLFCSREIIREIDGDDHKLDVYNVIMKFIVINVYEFSMYTVQRSVVWRSRPFTNREGRKG